MKNIIIIAVLIVGAGCSDYQTSGQGSRELIYPTYPTLVKVVGSNYPTTRVVIPPLPPSPSESSSPTTPGEISGSIRTPVISQNGSSSTVIYDREIYLSGGLRNEVRWAVIRELRNQGYVVTTKSRTPLKLRINMNRGGNRIVCTAILYNQDGQVVSQGIGEADYWRFRVSGYYMRIRMERVRYDAEIKAAVTAVRSL